MKSLKSLVASYLHIVRNINNVSSNETPLKESLLTDSLDGILLRELVSILV